MRVCIEQPKGLAGLSWPTVFVHLVATHLPLTVAASTVWIDRKPSGTEMVAGLPELSQGYLQLFALLDGMLC